MLFMLCGVCEGGKQWREHTHFSSWRGCGWSWRKKSTVCVLSSLHQGMKRHMRFQQQSDIGLHRICNPTIRFHTESHSSLSRVIPRTGAHTSQGSAHPRCPRMMRRSVLPQMRRLRVSHRQITHELTQRGPRA